MTTDISIPRANGYAASPPRNWADLFRRFLKLAGGFWGGSNWAARGLITGLVGLTAAQVTVQVALNLWTERLFNAFDRRSMGEFSLLAVAFALILVANLTVNLTHMRVKRRIQIGWRQWLARRLSGEWMASGRHYRMGHMAGDHDNPDGRLSDDVRIATEAAIDLGHSLLYCIMLLVSFIHILWRLSGNEPLLIDGVELEIPGHLVWIALLYSAVGIFVALLLGPPLVASAEARQTYEANFRFGLVHARENSSAIGLVHGEAAERRRFRSLLDDVQQAWDRQTMALFQFYIFSSSWSVLSPVFPILVAAPRYIAGTITLGALMQIAQAFQQAISALTWPIDNLSHAAEWRASVERILGLQSGIDHAKQTDWCSACGRIDIAGAGSPLLAFHDVIIVDAAGTVVVDGFSLAITRGQKVWLCGDPSETAAFIKALAGLSTAGSGRIELPSDGPLYFMPQRPYLPLAPLRDVVSYPAVVGSERDEEIKAALRRAGLEHLMDRLDDDDIWETSLSLGEQQQLGFARLLFHRPRWIVLEEPVDALSAGVERDMIHLLQTEFAGATLITAGDSAPAGIDWMRIPLPSKTAVQPHVTG